MIKEKGMTGTAKDIKKGLKEFREKHKDKNYNEYVNMYNENKKETIESDEISQCPKCKCITDTINNKETFESYYSDNWEDILIEKEENIVDRKIKLEKLKQLHDKKVEEMGNRNIVRMMKEKDKEIEKRKDMFWKMKEALKIKCDEYKQMKSSIDENSMRFNEIYGHQAYKKVE